MEKITILIADDHKLLLDTWVLLFNANPDFQVVGHCNNGEDTIALARTLHPQLIILDINMPGMDGFETTHQLRKYLPGCKILCISMHCLPVYVRKMMKTGAMGYVTKNSPVEEVFIAAKEIMKNNKYICQEIKDIITESRLGEDNEEKVGINSLSKRELTIISYIRKGLSSKMIAITTGIAVKTVDAHRHNILKKLHLPNVASLVNFVDHSELVIDF